MCGRTKIYFTATGMIGSMHGSSAKVTISHVLYLAVPVEAKIGWGCFFSFHGITDLIACGACT